MEPLEKAIHYYTVSNGTFCFVLSEWSVHENVQHECTVWGNYLCFQTMVRFHLAGNPVSHSEFLSDELKIFTAGTEGATIEIERLKQYSKVCDSRQTMSSCIKKAEKLLFGSYPPPPTPLLYFSDSPSCLPFVHLLSSFLVELEQQEWSLCLSSPLNFVNLLWLFRYFGRIVMKEVPLVNLFKKWNSETWKFSSFAERLKKESSLVSYRVWDSNSRE